jgi:hypothetical protein
MEAGVIGKKKPRGEVACAGQEVIIVISLLSERFFE